MIIHHDSYLRRINNPKSRSKSIEEHIVHFQKRLKERFDIEITQAEYFELVKNISKTTLIYKINSSNGLYSFTIKHKEVWALYSKGSKDRTVPRLKTVLIPFQGMIVPDSLNEHLNHTMFLEKVKLFVAHVKSISDQLDLNNRKDFFMRQDIDQYIKTAVLKFRKMGNHPKIELILINIAVNHLINVNEGHQHI